VEERVLKVHQFGFDYKAGHFSRRYRRMEYFQIADFLELQGGRELPESFNEHVWKLFKVISTKY
jgi:hypothetical protein